MTEDPVNYLFFFFSAQSESDTGAVVFDSKEWLHFLLGRFDWPLIYSPSSHNSAQLS